MSTGIFGELNLSKSLGHSSQCQPQYIAPDVFCYVSGNLINFVDTSQLSITDKQQQKQQQLGNSIIADSNISAFATFPQEAVIAYSHEASKAIYLVKWPSLAPAGLGTLTSSKDLKIVSLAFSSDGQYLASLGSLPTHTITCWDWKNNVARVARDNSVLNSLDPTQKPATPINPAILCSASNNGPAFQISFDPLDKRILCTSSPGFGEFGEPKRYKQEGWTDEEEVLEMDEFDLEVVLGRNSGICKGIRFWKIEMGYKSWELNNIKISTEDEAKAAAAFTQKLVPPTISNLTKTISDLGLSETKKESILHDRTGSIMAISHIWRSDHTVVCTTNSEDLLLLYNPRKATYKVLVQCEDITPLNAFGKPSDIINLAVIETAKLEQSQISNGEFSNNLLDIANGEKVVETKENGQKPTESTPDTTSKDLTGSTISPITDSNGESPRFTPDEQPSADVVGADDRKAIATGITMDQEKGDVTEAEEAIMDFRCVLVGHNSLITAGRDGVIRFIKHDPDLGSYNVYKQVAIPKSLKYRNEGVLSLSFSPTYNEILIEMIDKRIFSYRTKDDLPILAVSNEAGEINTFCMLETNNRCVSASLNGDIIFWDFENDSNNPNVSKDSLTVKYKFNLDKCNLSSISAAPFSSHLLAVGSAQGYVRVLRFSGIDHGRSTDKVDKIEDNVSSTPSMDVVFREKLHEDKVESLLFDPSGRYLITTANDHKCFLIDAMNGFKVLGYFVFRGKLRGVTINQVVLPDKTSIYLYLMSSDEVLGFSLIRRLNIPLQANRIPKEVSTDLIISEALFSPITYKVNNILTSITILPDHISPGKESIYVTTLEKKIVLYTGTVSTGGVSSAPGSPEEDVILLDKPQSIYSEHAKTITNSKLANSIDWLTTWSTDGVFTIRTLLEPEKGIRMSSHDPRNGGVKDLIIGECGRSVVSLGCDGVLKLWGWKFNTAGTRAYSEAVAEYKSNKIGANKNNISAAFAVVLENMQPVPNPNDSSSEVSFTDKHGVSVNTEEEINKEKEAFGNKIISSVNEIREQLVKAIKHNECLPSIEKIDLEEFVIDHEERDRLLAAADTSVLEVRQEIETENLKKIVIKDRIKKQCCDSMEVIGKTIKSFNVSPLTGKTIEVTNYPFRRRSEEEISFAFKIKTLRKTEIEVAKATYSREKKAKDLDFDEESSNVEEEKVEMKGIEALFYDPFEIITNERRRIQSVLLREHIFDLKKEFNELFTGMAATKMSEITKVEEKNERINEILAELQIKEDVIHPGLDDDEVPERIMEVQDNEIKFEKFITAEERRKNEEKRLQDEERVRAQQQDNWAERALQQMMGGKLEDKNEQDEKEELVRPDWMNKPKEDLNEEERKLIKEFDKKQATLKEEQEKYKKALETELRKLQMVIGEICDGFDRNLQEFFNTKLSIEQSIYELKVRIIKLTQASTFSENDDARQANIIKRLEFLKAEKMAYSTEIPEIKKELEKTREEYESLVKKEKELERQFKREFYSYDFFYESLLKLFRRREPVLESEETERSNEENPFYQAKNLNNNNRAIWEEPAPLNVEADLPEGVPMELWNKLVELRERKIGLESEIRVSLNKFQEMQGLVQAVVDESEKIRTEADSLASDLNQFLEYKFHTTYNVESLFKLKQGQVEIAQSPVVTDYSEAVLIHRSNVEKLNDSIISVGNGKVEALKEMKEYRKGIHALEWEIKMLDFQAEDQIIRTRDIQLLRLTKQMQEYLRSGDEHAQTTEILQLEKRSEYLSKAYAHKIKEKQKVLLGLTKKLKEKLAENKRLDGVLVALDECVNDRKKIHNVSDTKKVDPKNGKLAEILERRKLIDQAKSQAQDLAILEEESERLRLRTFPSFPKKNQGLNHHK